MARNPALSGSVFSVVVKELVWSSLEVGLVGSVAGVVVVVVELGRVFVDEVCLVGLGSNEGDKPVWLKQNVAILEKTNQLPGTRLFHV